MQAIAQTADTCKSGHNLKAFITPQPGTCDGCGTRIAQGSRVKDCRECNWYLCSTCLPETSCPSGHALALFVTPAVGICDGCNQQIAKDTNVVDCRTCNWYLCSNCQPELPPGPEVVVAASTTPVEQSVLASDCTTTASVGCSPDVPKGSSEASDGSTGVFLSARILEECTETDDGKTLFSISVQLPAEAPSADTTFVVKRRYSAFRDLRDGFEAGPLRDNFPRKYALRAQGKKLEQRRLSLDAWLQNIIPQQKADVSDLNPQLAAFLQVPAAPAA